MYTAPNLTPLDDQRWGTIIGIYEPILDYVKRRFNQKSENAIDQMAEKLNARFTAMKHPVSVLGFDYLPIAIELSQWGYSVNMTVEHPDQVEIAENDCKRFDGSLKSLFYSEYLRLRGAVCLHIGLLNGWQYMTSFDSLKEIINSTLSSHRTIITTSVKDNSTLLKYLDKHFSITVLDGNKYWIVIIEKNSCSI